MCPSVADSRASAPRRARVVVVDDEPLARELVSGLVQRDPALELVGVASSGSEALALVASMRPDILLLDVEMPSLDGISVAEQLAGLPDAPYVIFVTAHDEFALQAFEYAVRDYLVKPIGKRRFEAALLRARQAVCGSRTPRPEPLIVRDGEVMIAVLPEDIVWVGAANQYVELHTVDGSTYLLSQSLRQFIRDHPAQSFLRIHRSTLINVRHLSAVLSSGGRYRALMDDKTTLDIARNRRPLVTRLLARVRENSVQ